MEYRIKELCKEKGINLADLATKIGTSQASISRIITGNGNPTMDTMERISKALDVSISELIKEDTDKNTLTCPKCGTKFKMEE